MLLYIYRLYENQSIQTQTEESEHQPLRDAGTEWQSSLFDT